MPARTRIVVNPAANERRVQLSPARARVTVFGAGRGARDPQVEHSGEKRLTVVRGRMAITCNGALSVLEAGQSIAIAPGVEHAWWSTRAGELCVEIEAEPEAFGLRPAPACARRRRWAPSAGARLTVRIAWNRPRRAAWPSWSLPDPAGTGGARSASRCRARPAPRGAAAGRIHGAPRRPPAPRGPAASPTTSRGS